MKKVLITGISGFIGSRMATFLAQRQLRVFGWNRIGIHDEYGSAEVNMHQENDVIKALENCNPDIIIHCAGSADVGKSVVNPTIDFEGNVKITHNLMFAMHKLGLEKTRFVFLSSAGVYGNPVSLPISEDAPLNPLSPYAVHKVMCEDLCKYFTNNYGTNVKVARIFSAYGAGLKKQIFWDMFQKYKNAGKLNMFGTGNESRDYIHVDDLVQALYLLAMTDDSEVFYNVANGEEITIREATEQFANKYRR